MNKSSILKPNLIAFMDNSAITLAIRLLSNNSFYKV